MSRPRIPTRMLVTLALLSAVEVVLARFIIPMPSATMRFSIEAVPIIVAGLLFGPLPGGESGDPFVSLYDWWTEFSSGKANNWAYILLAAFLWITIIGYYLSYRLSCKLYLKGVEQYDK